MTTHLEDIPQLTVTAEALAYQIEDKKDITF